MSVEWRGTVSRGDKARVNDKVTRFSNLDFLLVCRLVKWAWRREESGWQYNHPGRKEDILE